MTDTTLSEESIDAEDVKAEMLNEIVTSLRLLHDANQVELRLPGSNMTITLEELANDFMTEYG